MAESLVALRDRRHQVISRLSEAYADDLVDVDELDRRLDVAHGARTVAELDELVADLGPAAPTALVPVGPTAIDDPARADRKRQRVILGSLERRGRWAVPRTLELRVFWASAELDFRDASLAPGVTTLDIGITMGNLELIVPPDLAVDMDVSSFMGSVEERHRVPPEHDPSQPLLRVTGAVRLGNLELVTRLPGETARDARRRERRERKQLRGRGQRALPPGE